MKIKFILPCIATVLLTGCSNDDFFNEIVERTTPIEKTITVETINEQETAISEPVHSSVDTTIQKQRTLNINSQGLSSQAAQSVLKLF